MIACLVVACGGEEKKLFQQAQLQTSKGNYTEAINIYSRLLKKNPKHSAALTNRGILWERLPAKDAAQKQKNREYAEQDYLKAIGVNPAQPETYNNLGALYLDTRQYDDSVYYFSQALLYRPDYFTARMNRAIAYSNLGQFSSSLNDFSEAINLHPTDPLVYLNRGLAYFNMSRYEAAASDFSRVIAIDPENARAYVERARAFIRMGYPSDAFVDLQEAVTLKPTYAIAYYYMGDLLFRKGDKEQALGYLIRAKELASQYVPTYELMGDMLALEDPVAATSNYMVAAKLDPANASYYRRKMEMLRTEEGREQIMTQRFFAR